MLVWLFVLSARAAEDADKAGAVDAYEFPVGASPTDADSLDDGVGDLQAW